MFLAITPPPALVALPYPLDYHLPDKQRLSSLSRLAARRRSPPRLRGGLGSVPGESRQFLGEFEQETDPCARLFRDFRRGVSSSRASQVVRVLPGTGYRGAAQGANNQRRLGPISAVSDPNRFCSFSICNLSVEQNTGISGRQGRRTSADLADDLRFGLRVDGARGRPTSTTQATASVELDQAPRAISQFSELHNLGRLYLAGRSFGVILRSL